MDSGNMRLIASSKFELLLVFLWTLMIPLSIYTGWIYSVAFVSAISLYANVASHWAAYRAARTEKMVVNGN
jgi:hypothetical protein